MSVSPLVFLVLAALVGVILYFFNAWVINTARTVPFSLSEIFLVAIFTILIDAFAIFGIGPLLLSSLPH